ncbi:uncharacterized protein LOC144741996, partial [Lampetra planeri]
MDWLQGVSAERGGPPLENCVLSCPEGPVRLPWKELLQPEFVDVPSPPARQDSAAPEESAMERGGGDGATSAAAAAESPAGSEDKPGDDSASRGCAPESGDAGEVNRSQTCLGRRRVSPAGSTRASHTAPGGSRGGLELATERRGDVDDDDAVAAAAANKLMVETKRAEPCESAQCLHNESASAVSSHCQGAPCLVGVAFSAVASSNNRKYAAVSDANVASWCRGATQEGSHQSELVQSNVMRRGNDCQVGPPHQPPISSRAHSDAGNAAAAVFPRGAASDPESYSDGTLPPGARAERAVVPTRGRRLPERVGTGASEDAHDHRHGPGEPPSSGKMPKSIFGQLHFFAPDNRGGCEQPSLGASLPRSEAAMAAAATRLLAATCARPGATHGALGLTASESPAGKSTGSACGDVDEMEGRVRIFDVRTTSGGRAPRGEPNDRRSWDVSQLGTPCFHSELFNCPQTNNDMSRVGLLTTAHGIPPGGIARLPGSPGEVETVCGPPLGATQRHRDGTDDGMASSPRPAERVRVPTEQTPLAPTADNDAPPQELSAGGVGTVPAEMPGPEETESKGSRVTEELAEREVRPVTAHGAFHSAGLNESLQMSRPQPAAPAAPAAPAVFDPPVTVSGERRAADGGSRAPAPQGRRALPADAWEGTSGDRERGTRAGSGVAEAPEEIGASAAPAGANALAGAALEPERHTGGRARERLAAEPVGDRKALWEDDEGGRWVNAGDCPSRAAGTGSERADDDEGVDELVTAAAAAGDADGGRLRDDVRRVPAGAEGVTISRSPFA